MAMEGTLWGHIGTTLFRVGLGFLLGTIAAVLLGAVSVTSLYWKN